MHKESLIADLSRKWVIDPRWHGITRPYEAEEVIELSLSILERRQSDVQLQWTRSKSSVSAKPGA